MSKLTKEADKNLRKYILREQPSPYLTEQEKKVFRYILCEKERNTFLLRITSDDLELVETGCGTIIRLSDLRELRCKDVDGQWKLFWEEIEKY